MPESLAQTATVVEMREGTPGELGGATTGVMWIGKGGRDAGISLGGKAGTTYWAATLDIRPGSEIATPGGVWRVAAIDAKARSGPGTIRLEPVAGPGIPANSIQLPFGGGLRVGRNDIDHMTALKLVALEPNETQPVAAKIEWWPALFDRADADPAEIHSARLVKGNTVQFATGRLTVDAIEGAGSGHPARVIFRQP